MGKIVTIIILLAVIGGGVLFYKQKINRENPTVTTDIDATASQNQSEVKEFTIVGTNFLYEPKTINVKKGDTVKIIFKNNDGYHDLRVDGYNVATASVNTGAESSVQFVADKTGSFEYYCTVGNHREKGMRGMLVVTE